MSARSKFFDDEYEVGPVAAVRPPAQLDSIEKIKKFFERSEIRVAIGAILAAIIIGYFAGNIFGSKDLRQTQTESSTSVTGASVETSTSIVASPTKIKIYITGEVNKPGVYELENTSRLTDALVIAGNTTSNADLTACNLAGFLSDGIKIAIPAKGQSAATASCLGQAGASTVESGSNESSSSATVTPGSTLVNLNTATQSQLEELPGVGPSYATAIIDFRSKNGGFKSVEDLRDVKGIGDKRFEDLKSLVTI